VNQFTVDIEYEYELKRHEKNLPASSACAYKAQLSQTLTELGTSKVLKNEAEIE
jgi:hypothetical protein